VKVLLVKMSSMGDVIHTLPAITDAKNALPDLQIDWVVEEGFQQIPSWHPGVNKVIPLGFRRLRKNPLTLFFSEEWKSFVHTIRAENYDLVLDAQGLLKSAVIARLALLSKTSSRHGLDNNSSRGQHIDFLYNKKYKIPRNK